MLAIIAGILVARHLKSVEELNDTRESPRTSSMLSSAIIWAERILRKIDARFEQYLIRRRAADPRRFRVGGRAITRD